MTERPEQPPEGRLLGLAQKRAKLSGRKAAKRAGISDGRWRQIVNGYQTVSAGVYAPVRAPADTLARMAEAVSVTPAQLEDADRADAAEELRTLLREPTPIEQRDGAETIRERRDRLHREWLAAEPTYQPDIEQLAQDLLDLRGDPEGMAQLRELLSGTPLEDDEIFWLLEGDAERERVRRLARYLKDPGPRGETLRQLLESWGDHTE